jgi:hypothetical protein
MSTITDPKNVEKYRKFLDKIMEEDESSPNNVTALYN